jgi:hypothetical protein
MSSKTSTIGPRSAIPSITRRTAEKNASRIRCTSPASSDPLDSVRFCGTSWAALEPRVPSKPSSRATASAVRSVGIASPAFSSFSRVVTLAQATPESSPSVIPHSARRISPSAQ